MSPQHPTTVRHPRRRLLTVGVVAAGLSVAGASAAAAVAPTSTVGAAVHGALEQVGVDWSGMPDGYTREQYEAFWGAGYTAEDVAALAALWSTGDTETKARAGQMILDGQAVPVAPGSTHDGTATPPADAGAGSAPASSDGDDWPSMPDGYTQAQYEAFWGAGYTGEDVEALGALWSTEPTQTKARAGQMLLDGQTPPVAPSGTPASVTS